jgi:lysozyme
MTLRQKLINQLMRDEGYRLKPYKCTSGKATIGVGRNLDDVGLSDSEVMILLSNDIDRVEQECSNAFDFWGTLDDDRKSVLLNMCFNLGITGLCSFKQTIKSIRAREYRLASKQMLDSKWAKQVGGRAVRLSKLMAGEQ